MSDEWEAVADRFVEGYGNLRGRVRTYVIDEHLRAHLPSPPARLVDVGGGAGHQAIPLARAGYDVTIVDPSERMANAAERMLGAEPPEVSNRVRLVRARGEDAPARLGPGAFDGTLCHGVVMYVEDPVPLVGALCALTAPGGVVSVVAKNRQALALRPALRGDWAHARRAFDATTERNALGIDTRADSVEEIGKLLRGGRVDPVAWYGVRLFTDAWTPERRARDSDADVLAVELEASRRDPYRQLSRLFHLVGVKSRR